MMQETEISLKEVLFCALRQWRKIVVAAIICAILLGTYMAITRAVALGDEKQRELWQTEYEIAYGVYWAEIQNFDRKISGNEVLASQAEHAITRLDIQKREYEGRIEDYEAKITYYQALIKDYEANIENLRKEKEKLEYYLSYRKEQNEKSLLMDIDPYNVNVHDIYLRVDSGYEIIPGSSIQNVDPTNELIQTYRLLVNNTSFYEKMISDLELDTEVRYLTEVIGVSEYGVNSIRVRVISDDSDWSKKVAEYVVDVMVSNKKHVTSSIADHDLTEYNTNSYSVVDLDVYSRQYSFIQEEINYETSIRNVDTSILNIETNIRNTNTDIRSLQQSIESLNLSLEDIPLQNQRLTDSIAGYRDANFELKSERQELLKEPEPKYEGYTVISIFTGFVLFAIIGGMVGAVLVAVYFGLVGAMSGKVLSNDKICDLIKCNFFGYWPKKRNGKLAFIDKWIDRITGITAKGVTNKSAIELVLSNATVACNAHKKILICGGAPKEATTVMAEAMKTRLPGVDFVVGGTIDVDPITVRALSECDAIILVERLDKSSLSAAISLKERAQAMNKTVLGAVIV